MSISIAMATYNGAAFLGEQLDSIISQTHLPGELIVCDDQSTDQTLQILRDYASRSPFPIRIEVNEQRLGSTKNFEKAIGLCTGDIIALCDQDDVWLPHKLQTIADRFEREPDLGLVFSNGYLIDETGARLPGDMWSRFFFHPRIRRRMDQLAEAYDLFLSLSFMTGATMAFRSQFRELCLPIPDKSETFIHDRWIALVIAAVGRVGFIPGQLISYRLHWQQQMGVGKKSVLQLFLTPASCSSEEQAVRKLHARLSHDGRTGVSPVFLQALEARRQHVAARHSLPSELLPRLKGVAREYFSGRYIRYPYGRAQAIRDILVGTR
jgi:glycosyltransferase involved in cell wall biosynthesis